MKGKLLSGVVLLLASASANAWELQYYTGFGVGQGTFTRDADGVERELARRNWTNPQVSMKDTTNTWKAYAGTYFSPYLGLQIGYANLGNADVKATANVNPGDEQQFVKDMAKSQPDLGKGVQVSVAGRFPISENFTVHDWLGVFIWKNESTATIGGEEVTETTTGTNFVLGAAVEYRLNYELGLRLEFERFNQSTDAVNIFGAGLAYYF